MRPISIYVTVFGTLMVLTAVTVAVAFMNLGSLNFPVAIGIAITKATLVILFFMHVKYSSKLTKFVVGVVPLLPGVPLRPDVDRLPVARLADVAAWHDDGRHAGHRRPAAPAARRLRPPREPPQPRRSTEARPRL